MLKAIHNTEIVDPVSTGTWEDVLGTVNEFGKYQKNRGGSGNR